MKESLKILNKYLAVTPVDVESAAGEIGIDVIRRPMSKDIAGMIKKVGDDSYQIVVNSNDVPQRQRFTIAHELGHYIYHRDLIGDGVSDSPAYRSPDETIYIDGPLKKHHETQANQFAANLLMPRKLLSKAEIGQGTRDIPALAKQFGVSLPSMRIRLGLEPYPETS